MSAHSKRPEKGDGVDIRVWRQLVRRQCVHKKAHAVVSCLTWERLLFALCLVFLALKRVDTAVRTCLFFAVLGKSQVYRIGTYRPLIERLSAYSFCKLLSTKRYY